MAEHCTDGAEQQHYVTQHGPVLHVAHIQRLGFLGAQIGTTGHLPRAGDAGLDQHSRGVQLAIALVLFRQWRTWTYHAHVSYEHIEELRQFIYGETTNEMTDFRDSRVILHLEDEAVLLAGLFSQLGL